MEKKLIFGLITLLFGTVAIMQLSMLSANADTPLSYPVTYFDPSPTDTVTPTPTVTAEPENTGNQSNNSNNSSSEQKSEPAACNTSMPGGAPVLISASQTSKNQVTLFWNKAADPVTHYAIVYGTAKNKEAFSVLNTGNVTSYTINELSGGTVYFFKVFAVNSCKPGAYSNELSSKAVGKALSGSKDKVKGISVEKEVKKDNNILDSLHLKPQNNFWNSRIFVSFSSFLNKVFHLDK